ncbi:two-component sensor histidine kinases, putative [Listeria welshimeri serovar 6b str. SLCC5334]|uniref:Two-component sensor histidine kinases, putative n=2 Tax=Listeria welshimeri TaxID=1643 RepID=A0AGS3_LISW6|nr:two-component sensor histidine kinases, putative [Listeria welshimeri serovar 6b str. SLCC5334]SNV21249.1 sensory histidine kinase DcuS [Listeria welshimeri]
MIFNIQTYFVHIYECGLQYLLIYFLFSRYKPIKLRVSKQKLILIFSIIILVHAFFATFEYFTINVIVSGVLYLVVSFFFFTRWQDILMSSIIATAVIDIGEGVASMLLMSTAIGSQEVAEFMLKPSNTMLLFTISRLISLGLVLIMLRFRKIRTGSGNLPTIYWTTFLFIMMKDILWVLILTDSPVEISFYYWAAVIPLLPISYILFYYTRRSIEKMIKTQVDRKVLDEKNKYYEQQLVAMEQTLESQRTIRHDLKNKLSPLIYLAESGKTDKLVKQVQELGSLSVLGKIYAESGNIMIDYIINLKLQPLANKDVVISCETNVPNDIDVAPFDLSTILGNLIDNAAEALEYAPNEKWIRIKVSYQVGFLMIQVSNSFDGVVHLDKKKIISRKGNIDNHGIGLASIETIAKEYNGEMIVRYDEQQFNMIVKLLA